MQGLFSKVVSVVEEVRVATIRFELGGNLQNNGGVTQQDLGGGESLGGSGQESEREMDTHTQTHSPGGHTLPEM